MNNNSGPLNMEKLVPAIYSFLDFVHNEDGDRPLSFVDKSTFLGRTEGYKSRVSELARQELGYDKWKESYVGSGKILECCRHMMDRAGNLVDRNQQILFKNMLNPEHEKYRSEAERALYDVYKSVSKAEEEEAFLQACQIFGGHYDTIGYLFFVKDSTRFLPVRSRNFERSLASIGIEYPMDGRCSWENYTGFIEIVRDVQTVLRDIIPNIDVRLIDAHSFLWVINRGDFRDWKPNETDIESLSEKYLNHCVQKDTARKNRLTSFFTRSVDVAKLTKARANGICQLCGKSAPFIDKNGDPYLESHHIIWLSRGGKDSTDNTAALCPNCHARMHVVDDPADVEKLRVSTGRYTGALM